MSLICRNCFPSSLEPITDIKIASDWGGFSVIHVVRRYVHKTSEKFLLRNNYEWRTQRNKWLIVSWKREFCGFQSQNDGNRCQRKCFPGVFEGVLEGVITLQTFFCIILDGFKEHFMIFWGYLGDFHNFLEFSPLMLNFVIINESESVPRNFFALFQLFLLCRNNFAETGLIEPAKINPMSHISAIQYRFVLGEHLLAKNFNPKAS